MPRAVAAAVHLVLAYAVLFGIVHSGGRYFYCEALGLLPSDPCAEASHDARGKGPLGMLDEQRLDCCEVVTLAAMPPAAQGAAPGVAPAASVAVPPSFWLARLVDSASPPRLGHAFKRSRPPPWASDAVHSRLMVFLV